MTNDKSKLRVLFKGWFSIPHSYSMVNCFQLVHLHKWYGEKMDIYIEEQEYFRKDWNNAKQLVFRKEYDDIIKSFKVYSGEKVDVIYSIVYPYNISVEDVPKCVFYTSEFSKLDRSYFSPKFNTEQDIEGYCKENRSKLYFTSPSAWSAAGMKKLGIEDSRNCTITHGVDCGIFKLDLKARESIRNFYKIEKDDVLLINIGAMTQNKGIMLILEALHKVVNEHKRKHVKVLLKGTGDLYSSKNFLERYFEILQNEGKIKSSEVSNLLRNNIVFTDKTFSYDRINDLFNAADLYISPYLAEGFNLTVLESLSAGLPVMVPKTGSTEQYIMDIKKNGGESYIIELESCIQRYQDGMQQNNISVESIVETLMMKEKHIIEMKEQRIERYNEMREYITNNYSWKQVAGLLYNYLKAITTK